MAVDGVDVEVDEDRVVAVTQEGDVADDVFGAGGGAGFSVDGEDGEWLCAARTPVDETG